MKQITITYKDGSNETYPLKSLYIESGTLKLETESKKVGSLLEMYLPEKQAKKIKEIKII